MGRSKCPLCFVRVPWTALLTHSYEIECPACRAELELSRYTRMIAGFGGIAGAILAARLADGLLAGMAWMTPMIAAILGFGCVSAFCVLLTGDLVVRSKAPLYSFPHSREVTDHRYY